MHLRPGWLPAVPVWSACLFACLTACVSDPSTTSRSAPATEREPDQTAEIDPLLSRAQVPHQVVAEAFITAATPDDNIDSPAAWATPGGELWLFATAKQGDRLVVYDGETGQTLRSVGGSGAGAGRFERPNGIAVHGDLLFVVERDNRRVQVLALPSLRSLATFGENQLLQPYGLWVRELAPGTLEVLVTDAYMLGEDANGDEIVPPLAQLDRRVQRYRIDVAGDGVSARHVGAFGDTSAAGAIRIPESIWGDETHDRLLIAEEDIATGTAVREYDLDGNFQGRTVGLDTFKAQAEGIALWTCPDGSGYWLTTDQFKDRSLFHVYDRQTLRYVGAFAGQTVGNTDGVWLHQAATTRFPAGVFFAVHDDMAVAAFDWREIAGALELRKNCDA